jgi:hypothetical protein
MSGTCGTLAAAPAAEEPDQGLDPALARRLGDVGRRLDAERRDAALDEVLQQVTVVGRELDHLAGGPQAEPLGDHRDVAPGVLEPRGRERREVGVLGEDVLGRDVLLELDQQAAVADPDLERVERLHLVGLVGGEDALAQRRHPEIAQRVGQAGVAEPAGRRGHATTLSGRPNGGEAARLRLAG